MADEPSGLSYNDGPSTSGSVRIRRRMNFKTWVEASPDGTNWMTVSELLYWSTATAQKKTSSGTTILDTSLSGDNAVKATDIRAKKTRTYILEGLYHTREFVRNQTTTSTIENLNLVSEPVEENPSTEELSPRTDLVDSKEVSVPSFEEKDNEKGGGLLLWWLAGGFCAFALITILIRKR